MLVDELSASRSSTSTPSILTPRSQSVADVRPTVVSCHPSQALSARRSQSTPQPQASSSRQGDGPGTESQSQGIRKVYSPLSSKLPEAWRAQAESSQHAQSQRPPRSQPPPQTPSAPSLSGMFGGRNNSIHQSNWPIHQQPPNAWLPDGRRNSDPNTQRPSLGLSTSRGKDDSNACKYPHPSHRTYKMGEDFRERALEQGLSTPPPNLRAATFTPQASQRAPAIDDDISDDDTHYGRSMSQSETPALTNRIDLDAEHPIYSQAAPGRCQLTMDLLDRLMRRMTRSYVQVVSSTVSTGSYSAIFLQTPRRGRPLTGRSLLKKRGRILSQRRCRRTSSIC